MAFVVPAGVWISGRVVPERIGRAEERARRDPVDITLLEVTKVFPAEAIREAYALGCASFVVTSRNPMFLRLSGIVYEDTAETVPPINCRSRELRQMQTAD